MDFLIDLILLLGITFCWWRIVAMPLGDEHFGIQKDMQGNGAHGPHRTMPRTRHWWMR